jgi:hypothetical protein
LNNLNRGFHGHWAEGTKIGSARRSKAFELEDLEAVALVSIVLAGGDRIGLTRIGGSKRNILAWHCILERCYLVPHYGKEWIDS